MNKSHGSKTQKRLCDVIQQSKAGFREFVGTATQHQHLGRSLVSIRLLKPRNVWGHQDAYKMSTTIIANWCICHSGVPDTFIIILEKEIHSASLIFVPLISYSYISCVILKEITRHKETKITKSSNKRLHGASHGDIITQDEAKTVDMEKDICIANCNTISHGYTRWNKQWKLRNV